MIDLDDLRSRARKVIDTSWLYSMHWGKEPEKRHWTMDAKHDCIERIYYAERELTNLKRLRKELEEICPIFVPEGEQPEPKCKTCGDMGMIDWSVVASPNIIPPSAEEPCPDCNKPEEALQEKTGNRRYDVGKE